MSGSKQLYRSLSLKKSDPKNAIIEAETDQAISYQKLWDSIQALQIYLGAEPKTIVLALPSGILDSIIWLAALMFGHRLIPISPFITDYEFKQVIKQHKPDLIIDQENAADIAKIITQKAQQKTNVKPSDGSIYLSTSGSTGTPKGVVLSTTKIVITAENICEVHMLTDKDRGLTCLPFYHVNAPVVSLITTILSGSTLIIAPKYSTSRFWSWVKKYDPTWISIVPTMVAMLLSTKRPSFLNKSSLRFIRTASEPLPAENLKRFEAKFKLPVIETYGLTEAASTICANPLPPYKHKPGSVGKPIGVEIKIVANKKQKAKQGETGEVWVKGKNVIDHYEADKSPDSFSRGWFKTGDLGHFDQDGYLFLTGRSKDIIIRGGENIAPREIEEVLLTHPNVKEATVVGHPDPIYGEKVVAFVVLNKDRGEKSIAELLTYAKSKLTPQKVPTRLFSLENLPRNKNNKVDKHQLRLAVSSK